MTDEVVLLYDVHRGKGHHRHVRGKEALYQYHDPATLISDFQRDVELIVQGEL